MKMIIAAVLCGLLIGAEEFVPKLGKDVYLDPKEAGIEYKMQGEYVGELGAKKLAAQVVDHGNGKFVAGMKGGGMWGGGGGGGAGVGGGGGGGGEGRDGGGGGGVVSG